MLLAEIQNRIQAVATAPITLVAVSKKQPIEKIQALYQQGHRDFGENYAQELIEKASQAHELGLREIRWHFIGHLQTNKVKTILPWVQVIHSVDSDKLAREINKRVGTDTPEAAPLSVFLEVNLEGEVSKSGVSPADAPKLAKMIASLTNLKLLGLMAIPDPQSTDSPFRRLRELEALCRPHTQGKLSMGMSSDFEAAIQAGATHVRLGTALFGERI